MWCSEVDSQRAAAWITTNVDRCPALRILDLGPRSRPHVGVPRLRRHHHHRGRRRARARAAAPDEWRDIDEQFRRGVIDSRECILDEWELVEGDEATLRVIAAEVALDPGSGRWSTSCGPRAPSSPSCPTASASTWRTRSRRSALDVLTNAVDFDDRRAAVPARGPLLPVRDVRHVQAGADQGRAATAARPRCWSATAPATARPRSSPTSCSPRARCASWCAAFGVEYVAVRHARRRATACCSRVVNVAFGTDEHTPLTDAVRAELERRGHTVVAVGRRAVGRGRARGAARRVASGRQRHRRAVLLDRHRGVDRGQQGAGRARPRSAPTPPPPPGRAPGTTPTCW